MDRFFSGKRAAALTVLILILAVFLAYSNTIHGAFQFDDETNITKNFLIRDLANLPEILKGARGVTMATFSLNYAAGGLNVEGYHIVNISIHALNAVLAYLLLFNTLILAGAGRGRARMIAAFSALVFALHPVQTQAVTYIVQRMESLSALFYLLALLLFAAAVKTHSRRRRFFFYFLVVFSYVLGFYSKEIAVTLPVVIFLYDLYFAGGGELGPALRRWPLYLLLAGLMTFFTINTVAPLGGFSDLSKEASLVASGVAPGVIEKSAPTAPPVPNELSRKGAARPSAGLSGIPANGPSAGFGLSTISPYDYFLTQSNVLLYYYSLLLVPVNQNVDYDFPVSKGLFETPVLRSGAVLNIPLPPPALSITIHLAIIVLAIYLFLKSRGAGRLRGRVASFFILWFFIILAPTTSFVPIADVIFEHRLYLSTLAYSTVLIICLEAVFIKVFGKAEALEKKPFKPSAH